MPQPIERHGYHIDDAGLILHDDRPVSWERIDEIAGRRMDRRKRYAIIDGEVCSLVQWTARCSGCTNGHEDRGFGCEECGYHGVVRDASWCPESICTQTANKGTV